MLDSNNLSGQIPQHLSQVQSYKYEQLIIMDNFKEYINAGSAKKFIFIFWLI